MMRTEQALDYAVFQLSPNRSRCELLVSSNGCTERLASGLVKPFVAHLKIAEEQFALAAHSIKLETGEHKPDELWFTKGTLERFVRFVSTPEILELVNRLDTELSQLEAARMIYSQQQDGADQFTGMIGGDGNGKVESTDHTKKELLRAIDLRLAAVKQDLTAASTRAVAAGFSTEAVLELQLFAGRFGAHRLSDACKKVLSLYERRPELINPWSSGVDDRAIRSSFSSDMSIDDSPENHKGTQAPQNILESQIRQQMQSNTNQGLTTNERWQQHPQSNRPSTIRQSKSSLSSFSIPRSSSSKEPSVGSQEDLEGKKEDEFLAKSSPQAGQPARRLSVQERINLFESKQKESSGSGNKAVVGKSLVLRRLSSDASTPAFVEKAVLRRWSAASDMSLDLSNDKDTGSPLSMSASSGSHIHSSSSVQGKSLSDTASSLKPVALSSPEDHPEENLTSNDQISQGKFSSVVQKVPFIAEVALHGKQNDYVVSDSLPSRTKMQGRHVVGDVIKNGFERPENDISHSTGLLKSEPQKQISGLEPMKCSEDIKEDSKDDEKMELLQRLRQARDNQELNTIEGKLRTPADRLAVSQKNTSGLLAENVTSSKKITEIESASDRKETVVRGANSAKKALEYQDCADAQRQNISEVRLDDFRGKFYNKYSQKRDAKLRQESGSKRAEKEAKLKAMQDSLERSREEMKAKFLSRDMQDSTLTARKRAEKLRSFNLQPTKHPVNSLTNDEDEEPSAFHEKKLSGEDSASGTPNFKKLTLNKCSSSSSTPRASTLPIARSSIKSSNSVPGKRRENPLAQSVPNFSDLKKENTKPSSAGNKTVTRASTRNYPRSKSTGEDLIAAGKEEKHRCSQSMKKNSTSAMDEPKQGSSLSSENVVLTPLKLEREQSESSPQNTIPSSESLNVIRKDIGTSGIYQDPNLLMPSLPVGSQTEAGDVLPNPEGSLDADRVVKRNLGRLLAETFSDVDEDITNPSQDYAVIAKSGLSNDGIARPTSSVTESIAILESMQNSPSESPVSWHSRAHVPSSSPQEASDVDLSVESPVDSPSWNSSSVGNTEGDDSQMRKQWGNAQKPVIVASTSQSQSRKDVKSGFKRLLKFGRKTRGTENLADWISATTSEGDDDTEDGRDSANRSSEDLRKSRMGFSQGHPSEDGSNEAEFVNDQVQGMNKSTSIPAPPANFKLPEDHMSGSSLKAPRSFFSLSTFRSKASDSKAR